MDHDRQWRIRDRLAGILAVAYGRHGATVRELGVIVDTDGSGCVTLSRRTVGYETGRTQADNGRRVIRTADHEDEARLTRAARRFADLHMALLERERCLESMDVGQDHVPAWSVAVDALLAHVAAQGGSNMDEMCHLTIVNGNPTADEKGFSLNAADPFAVQASGRTYRATIMQGWLGGGIVRHPFKIRCGADGAISYDASRSPKLVLMDQALPETMVAAATGRRLDEIVDHPMLRGSSAVITGVANVPGNVPKIEIRLQRRRVPLATAPRGVETPWLATIAELSS